MYTITKEDHEKIMIALGELPMKYAYSFSDFFNKKAQEAIKKDAENKDNKTDEVNKKA